jgi:hypothetical protein
MLRGMFRREDSSRSTSRSQSPNKQRGDVRSPSSHKPVDDEIFEIGGDSDTER